MGKQQQCSQAKQEDTEKKPTVTAEMEVALAVDIGLVVVHSSAVDRNRSLLLLDKFPPRAATDMADTPAYRVERDAATATSVVLGFAVD